MLILLLILLMISILLHGIYTMFYNIIYKIKISRLLNQINSKEDLLYLTTKDFINVVAEAFKRKGYKISPTDKCGEEGNGLILNEIKYVEIWKHSFTHLVQVEDAMKLANYMKRNSIYRGMLITLGDYKRNTKFFCHSNVIECINGDQLIEMCREVQRKIAVPHFPIQ